MTSAASLVMQTLSTLVPRPGPESRLAEDVRLVLAQAGLRATIEAELTEGRVDLRVQGTAVELKVRGSAERVLAQLVRYARDPTVVDVVLVTTSAKLRRMPSAVEGKPLHVVYLPQL